MPHDNPLEEEIFHAASEFSLPAEQAAYLTRACGTDAGLRDRIDKLLQIEAAAIEFFKPTYTDFGNLKQPVPIPSEGAGTVIGRYKLREKIGEGGCGIVYVAEQFEPVRRLVALKLIKAGMDTKNVLARFEAERQALAIMDHQNIARVFDAGTADTGRPYFVMELVRGTKITEYCDENHLAVPPRLDLFVKVCLAVQHAHQKGIIHRDLKPSNILVTLHDGVPVPKVIDFGIAKATEGRLTDATICTELHHFIGTPAYMSPEQAEMSGLDIDTRSDIYSLGVLLYELITGRTPFDTAELLKSGLDKMRQTIREQEPIRPSTRLSTMLGADLAAVARNHGTESVRLIHSAGGDLDWIVMKALEKDRRRRYENANDLGADVRRHLSDEVVTARPPGNLYRLEKLVRRHQTTAIAAATITLILLIGVTVNTWEMFRAMHAEKNALSAQEQTEIERQNEAILREEAQRQALIARQNAYAADMSSAAHAVADKDFGLARKLLDGYSQPPELADLRGFEWRYLRALSRGEQAMTLTGHSNSVNCIAYSPDGSTLASGSSDGTAKFWNATTGGLIGTCSGHSGEVFSVAFSRDGNLLTTGCQDGLVRLWDVATQKIVGAFTNHSARVAMSGPWLAMATDSSRWGFDGGSVQLWDYAANRKKTILPESGNRVAFSPDGKMIATANWEGLIKLWDLASSMEIRSFHNKLVRSLVFSPDGKTLAWSADEGDVRLWNLAEEQPLLLIKGSGNLVFGIAISPDGKTLAVADQSHDIILWNLSVRKEIGRLRGHGAEVWDVAFSPDGTTLTSASRDGTIMLWRLNGVKDPNFFTNVVTDDWQWTDKPVLSPNGKFLAAKSRNGGLAVWELATCKIISRLTTDSQPVGFSSDGRSLLVLTDGRTSLQAWDLATQTPRPEKIVLDRVVDAAVFSPDRKMIAESTKDLEVNLRSGISGELLFSLPETGRARTLNFSHDGSILGVVNYEGSAHLWNLASRQIVWTAEARQGIEGLAFSPDGRMFAVGGWDGSIKIFDAGTAKEVKSLSGHKAGITQLAFSNDGRTLASVGDDYFIRLWNLATSREITKLDTQNQIHFLQFTATDDALVVADADGTVRLSRAPVIIH